MYLQESSLSDQNTVGHYISVEIKQKTRKEFRYTAGNSTSR